MTKIILDDKYEIGLGIGCWAKSIEKYSVVEGDVRLIGNVLMSAYNIEPLNFVFGNRVWWKPIDDNFNSNENYRKWVKGLV